MGKNFDALSDPDKAAVAFHVKKNASTLYGDATKKGTSTDRAIDGYLAAVERLKEQMASDPGLIQLAKVTYAQHLAENQSHGSKPGGKKF